MRQSIIEPGQRYSISNVPSNALHKHNSTISIIQDKSEFNIQQYKLRQQCTYFQYGEITISQKPFCCEVCDPNKTEFICYECMVNCHKTCSKDAMKVDEIKEETKEEAKDLKKKDHLFFICECGKKKHEILRKSDNDLEKRCLFNEFNTNLLMKYRYNCKTCKCSICYICFITCHKKRNGCTSERIPLKNRRMYQGDATPCDCITATHSNVITLTQIINQMIEKEEYEDVKFIWKLQVFNSFCMTQMSGLLFNQTAYVLKEYMQDALSKKNILNQCDKFVRLSKCIFKSQKYFYYKEAFITMYPHDKMINVITSFQRDYEKYGNFICSLCFFFYFFHLKKDFQNVKGLCIVDFFISSPLDRILFKKVIHSKNIYNLDLYEKYFNKEKDNDTLDQICIKLLKVLQLAIKEFTVKNLIKCFKNYFTILKIVFFCLKRFVFNMRALTVLIDHFMAISSDIYHFMEANIRNDNKNRLEVISFLKTVMIYITKINCAIIVNYNDLIIYDMLFNEGTNATSQHFAHYSNETTKKIAKIIVITSVAYGEFIINNNDANKEYKEYKEYLVFLNHLLDMLMLTNNVYYRRINEVSYEDFRDFHVMWKTVDELSSWVAKVDKENAEEEENRVNANANNDKENYTAKKIERDYGDEKEISCEEVIRINVFNMKEEIEMCYVLFFHYQKKFEAIADQIELQLKNFCIKDSTLLDKKIDHSKPMINEEIKVKGSFNSNLKSRQLVKYNKTIMTLIFNAFPCLNNNFMTTDEGMTCLINELILSSFDTTITKLFFVDKSNKLLTEEKVRQILSFLMIFTLSKTGLLHFCLGRNFRRIIKVLSLFPNIASEYLYLIFKGIYLNDIPIKSHKKVPKIKEELLAYLTHINIKILEESKQYSKILSMIIDTIKVLKYLSYSMEISELIDIRESLSKSIERLKLITVDNFNLLIPLYNIYIKESEGNISSALNKEKEKYLFEKIPEEYTISPIVKYSELYKEKFEIFEVMNIQDYELWKPERVNKLKLNESFLFNYMEYITLSTFYIQKTESFSFINTVLQLDFIKYILNKKYLKLKYRRIVLSFLRIIYLTDQLYNNEHTIKTDKYPNSEEYFNIKCQDNPSEDMKEKLEEITSFKTVIDIFIQDLLLLPQVIIDERSNSTSILSHIQELLASIKSIGDIFITYDITSHATLWFYELVSKFKQRSNLIIHVLKHFMSSSTSLGIDDESLDHWLNNNNAEGRECNPQETYFNTKAFNIYNKEQIYHVLFNELQAIYSQTNFNSDFNLGKFLKTYKEANDMDFKVFSSIDSSEQEFNSLISSFNDEFKKNQQQDPTTIVSNDEDVLLLIRKFKQYQQCKAVYLNQFTSLKNISFVQIILNKSNDITIEFRSIYIEYLISMLSYINSINNVNLTNLFIIINKILYENYEKTQQCIQVIVTKKNEMYRKMYPNMTKTFDVFLFQELAKVLQWNISLQIIIAKSVIRYDRFNQICLLTKNMIQFYQLLGEGHNKSFQNLIVNGRIRKMGHSSMSHSQSHSQSQSQSQCPTYRSKRASVSYIEAITSNDNRDKEGRKVGFASDTRQSQQNQLDFSKSIFTVLFNALNGILHLVNIIPSIENSSMGELPYDKLILLIINIIDCVVEFFQGTTKDGYFDMYQKLIICLERISDVVKLKLPTKAQLRLKYLIILKSNLLEMICSILEEGTGDDPELNALKDVMILFKPIELYSEVVDSFQLIYREYLSNVGQGYTLEDRQLKGVLVELYKFNQSFQMSIELRLAMKIFYLLKILSEVYNRDEVITFFKELEPLYVQAERLEKIDIVTLTVKTKTTQNTKSYANDISNVNGTVNANQSINVHGISSTISPFNKPSTHDNLNLNLNPKTTPLIGKKASASQQIPNDRNIKEIEDQASLISASKMNYVIYSFLNELTIRIQIRNVENESTRDFSFFVIPPICFLLSNWTKTLFNENVDRDTVATKILTLIDETDYFIYEMFYNNKHMKTFNALSQYLFNVNMIHFQFVNFVLLFGHNISFMIHMFSWEPIPSGLKEIVFIDNYVLCGIHIGFIVIVLVIWLLYKLELKYKHHVMQIYKERFIFRRNVDSQVEGEAGIQSQSQEEFRFGSEDELLDKIGLKLAFRQKLYVVMWSVLCNFEVNMFVFTLFFLILFMIFGNGLCIAMPLLFIANLNNILYGIVYSLRLRWKQLIIVLIFAYLIVYIFSWFAFYYFPELFEWDELYDAHADNNKVTEKLCSSMFQCYLTMLNYGVRSGGGIGDVITKLSYKSNPGYYIAGFFFVVFFHIIVIWIMANLFFGIIVDTFAALREKTYRIEEDKKNICYICQITRDSAINKNINFDTHVQTVHSMWNYVYFLTFLHINNEKNFKSLETFVWDKIPVADTSWIPLREDSINKG